MSYCNGKPPARVLIQFKSGAKEEVVSEDVPITVRVRKKIGIPTEDPDPDSPHGGCCDIPYKVKVTYKVCSLGTQPNVCGGEVQTVTTEGDIPGKILGFSIGQFQGTDNALRVTRRGCDGREETYNFINVGSSSKLVGYSIQTITRADEKPDTCDPPDPDEGKCIITVAGTNGKIYEKTDECPIKFKVRCGDQCADGEIRCSTNTYPGYCCIDCGDLARNLRR